MPEELAGYAVTQNVSRGRAFAEPAHRYRTDFERDRDRIIHCSAFRRLEGKTQVFTPGLDDYYRTRMTHSIEVAQLGRTIAKALKLNVDLAEAICLAHDLGHTPFGHAGEEVLNGLMREFGGFEHNRQTVRVVELLEHPYPDFMGLNLMYETRLGLAKHSSPYDRPQGTGFEQLNCSLEGQVADVADRIAYNCHDLEDGIRARLFEGEKLAGIEIFEQAESRIGAEKISDRTIRRTRTAKAIMDRLVSDCVDASGMAIEEANIKTLDEVYQRQENLIVLSADSETALSKLEQFLMDKFYMHDSVMQTSGKVKNWLEQLFSRLCEKPQLMPRYFQRFIDDHGLERTVCDYIAGMTDRYCLKMFEKMRDKSSGKL